jgi:hypothetical protein
MVSDKAPRHTLRFDGARWSRFSLLSTSEDPKMPYKDPEKHREAHQLGLSAKINAGR